MMEMSIEQQNRTKALEGAIGHRQKGETAHEVVESAERYFKFLQGDLQNCGTQAPQEAYSRSNDVPKMTMGPWKDNPEGCRAIGDAVFKGTYQGYRTVFTKPTTLAEQTAECGLTVAEQVEGLRSKVAELERKLG